MITDLPLPPYRAFKAGDLSGIYEAGSLRYIKCGDTEVIRMIYGAVRDKHWETIVPAISGEVWTEDEAGISITYNAAYISDDIQYQAVFQIKISPANSILFSMKGTAPGSFEKNRTGLCVHHPLAACMGRQVKITRAGGDAYNGIFPELISPHQPFKDVQAMQWQPAPGLQATLSFAGDVFETEDHRNWSDSAYKTYSTPLHLPFPVQVLPGETMEQQVAFHLSGNTKQPTAPATITSHPVLPLPLLGTYFSGQPMLTAAQEAVLGKPVFHHAALELHLYSASWQAELDQAAAQHIKLELLLFFDDYEEELPVFLEYIRHIAGEICAILLLGAHSEATPPGLMKMGYDAIKAAYPFIKVGYGTYRHFAELNRNRPGSLPHDFVSFGLTPRVHAEDARSLLESLECQPDIIRTIRSFTGKDIHVTPLSFNRRGGEVKESESMFAAEWTLRSVWQLRGAASVTVAFCAG